MRAWHCPVVDKLKADFRESQKISKEWSVGCYIVRYRTVNKIVAERTDQRAPNLHLGIRE